MNHNYKLTDFNILKNVDTDIQERIVSIDLSNVRELPTIIWKRLEVMINKVITDHEQERNIIIPLEDTKLGMHLNIDTLKKELYLQIYIGYDFAKECLMGKDVITAVDEDYAVIKKYFFTELSHYVFDQIKQITQCA